LFADFLPDCLIATGVDIDWVAHDETLVPLIPPNNSTGFQGVLLDSSPFPCGESETAAFGYPSRHSPFEAVGPTRTFGYLRQVPSLSDSGDGLPLQIRRAMFSFPGTAGP